MPYFHFQSKPTSNRKTKFFLGFIFIFTLWTWKKGACEGRNMDEDQYDPFEDDELFVGQEEFEEEE